MRSLRARLGVLWVLSLIASLAVGWLLLALYRQSASAQSARAETLAARACEIIADRWDYYAAGWGGPAPGGDDAAFRRDMADLLRAAPLAPRIQAGLWRDGQVVAATAPPPAGLVADIDAAATEAVEDGTATRASTDEALPATIAACGLGGPVRRLAAFVVVPTATTAGFTALRAALGVLLALMLVITGLLTALQWRWSRHVRAIEAALASPEGALPTLSRTGERELDRIVVALNEAGARLAESRTAQARLAARMAEAERLAALGRVSAGVAHEIRNPIAAMRLRAENALAGDDARRRAALSDILAQIGRVDRLIGELLAMTQRRDPAPAATDLRAFLDMAAADHAERAAASGLRLSVEASGTALLDPVLTRRALDLLLDNALRETQAGGRIALSARAGPDGVTLEVADSGPGVPPDLRQTLFEPFVTGRADGTGLGLAIARGLVAAQGGSVTLEAGPGARFRIALPEPA